MENGLVMAVENPKQAAIRQAPRPTIVSNCIDSINAITSGKRVTSSSNIPNRLPKSINSSIIIQTIGPPRSRKRRITNAMNVLMPPVLSCRLNTPLITSRKMLIIMIVSPSSDANTRSGAVITRQGAMPSTSPARYVPGMIFWFASLSNAPCGTK